MPSQQRTLYMKLVDFPMSGPIIFGIRIVEHRIRGYYKLDSLYLCHRINPYEHILLRPLQAEAPLYRKKWARSSTWERNHVGFRLPVQPHPWLRDWIHATRSRWLAFASDMHDTKRSTSIGEHAGKLKFVHAVVQKSGSVRLDLACFEDLDRDNSDSHCCWWSSI